MIKSPRTVNALFPACSFTFTFIYWMLLAFLPAHLKSLGFTDSTTGTIIGLYSLSALCLMIPLGVLSDGVSPKKLLLFGSVAVWLHLIGMRYAFESWHFVVLAAVGGLGWAAFQVVLYALFLKVIGDERRGIRIAIFHAGQFLGYGLGPLLAGFLYDRMPFRDVMTVAAATGLVLNIFIMGLPDSEGFSLDIKGYRMDLTRGPALLFLGMYFLFAMHLGVEQVTYTLFLREDLGFNYFEVGFTCFAVGIWLCALSPYLGRKIDSRGSLHFFLISGLLLTSFFHMATAWAHTLWGVVAVRMAHTLGDGPLTLAIGILIASLFPRRRMGGNSAVAYAIRILGSFSGSVFAGFITPSVGYGQTFFYTGLVLFIVSIALIPFLKMLLPGSPGGKGAATGGVLTKALKRTA